MSTIPRQTAEIDPLAVISSNNENIFTDQSLKFEKTSSIVNNDSTLHNSMIDSLDISVHEFLSKCRSGINCLLIRFGLFTGF